MNIQKQNQLILIPFVNYVVIGIQWLLFYHKNPVSKAGILKVLLISFLCCIVITIPEIILDSIFSNATLELVMNLVASYMYMFIFSFFMLKDQQRYYNSLK